MAIVGYSHWVGNGDGDHIEVTQECISKVVSGEFRTLFFTAVRNYFGYEKHEDFWRRVMFFNFLPNAIGGPGQRFGAGTEDQVNIARDRFLRLIRENLPNRVLIFTSRHWAFPEIDVPLQKLGQNFPSKFGYRQYAVGSHEVTTAFFLRHPQGANKELMRRAVQHVLGWPNIDGEEERPATHISKMPDNL